MCVGPNWVVLLDPAGFSWSVRLAQVSTIRCWVTETSYFIMALAGFTGMTESSFRMASRSVAGFRGFVHVVGERPQSERTRCKSSR